MTAVAHPFTVGTRVRHYGRRWSTDPFATVVEVRRLPRGSFEYLVAVDADSEWITAGQETWWPGWATHPGGTS